SSTTQSSPFSTLPIPLIKEILFHIYYFSDIPHLRLVCKTWSKVIDQILFTRIINIFTKLYPIDTTLTLRCYDHSEVITEYEIQMELRTIPKPDKYTTKFMIEFLPINSLKKPLVKDLYKGVEAFFRCYYTDKSKCSLENIDKRYYKDDVSKENSDRDKNKPETEDNFPDIIKYEKVDDDDIGIKTKILKEVKISEILMLSLGTCKKSPDFSHEIAANLAIEFKCVPYEPMTFFVKSVGFRPLF
ncbi:11227_t:CDS:1, partial [Scutellospora calospora]